MTLEQYNRAKETEIYRHELELEMQRRRRYLEMCKMMEEYNQRYFHFNDAVSRKGVVVKACENESSRGLNPQTAHSRPTKPINDGSHSFNRCVDKTADTHTLPEHSKELNSGTQSVGFATAMVEHIPKDINEWLHEKTYSEENYIR